MLRFLGNSIGFFFQTVFHLLRINGQIYTPFCLINMRSNKSMLKRKISRKIKEGKRKCAVYYITERTQYIVRQKGGQSFYFQYNIYTLTVCVKAVYAVMFIKVLFLCCLKAYNKQRKYLVQMFLLFGVYQVSGLCFFMGISWRRLCIGFLSK